MVAVNDVPFVEVGTMFDVFIGAWADNDDNDIGADVVVDGSGFGGANVGAGDKVKEDDPFD